MTSYFIEDIGTSLDDTDGSGLVRHLKNADLSQGKTFLNYEDVVTSNTLQRLPYLELTSMQGLGSINEAFTDSDSLHAKNKDILYNVSENENAFYKTLSDYSTLQNQYTSSKMNGTNTSNDTEIVKQLIEFKNKLIYYAKKINTDISNLQVDDETLKSYILEKQTKLNNYIQNLSTQDNNTQDNNTLMHNSKHYNFLMWIIVLITIVCLFMYIITSKLVMNTLVVIICLLTIYILVRAITANNAYTYK